MTKNKAMIAAPPSTMIDNSYLIEIMDKLSSELHYKTYPAGQRFIFSANRQENCYLVKSGVVSVYRYPENVLIEIFAQGYSGFGDCGSEKRGFLQPVDEI